MQTSLLVELHWRFDLVGLDTADVEWKLRLQVFNERDHRLLEPCPRRLGSLGYLGDCLSALRPHLLEKCVVAGGKERRKGFKRGGHIVIDQSKGGMCQNKGGQGW